MSHAQLLEWYSAQRPIRLDLVGDYAGSSRFIIHGESLLRHCFSDSRIDFAPGGFQLLHAVYVVEQFLQNLARRKCEFDIIFLQTDERMCIPAGQGSGAWKWLCARGIMIKHLLALSRDGSEVRVFAHPREGEFLRWVAGRKPLFIMAISGDDASVVIEDSGAEVGDERGPGEAEEWEFKLMVYQFMCTGEGYNIALIDRVGFVDSKIFTYIIENNLSTRGKITIGDVVEPQQPRPNLELPEIEGTTSTRERLTIRTVVRFLNPRSSAVVPKLAVDFASVYLLHSAFLKHLSLEERQWNSLDRQETLREKQNKGTLEVFFRHMAKCATILLMDGFDSVNDDASDLCDFVDGRLVLKLINHGAGDIPEEVRSDFARLAKAVEGILGALGTNITLCIPAAVASGMASTEVHPPEQLPSTRALLPFSNPIFNTHLRSISLDSDASFHGSPEAYSLDKIFREETHWHNSRKPLAYVFKEGRPHRITNSNSGGKGQPHHRLIRLMGRQRRGEQIYLNQMQRYAASLTDSVDGTLNPKLIICNAGEEHKRIPVKTHENTSKKKVGKTTTVGSKATTSKAAQIKLANAEKSAVKDATALMNSWKHFCLELETSQDEGVKLSRLEEYMKKLQRLLSKNTGGNHEGRSVELEVQVYKILILQRMWVGFCEEGQKQRGFTVIAILFNEARNVLLSQALTVRVKGILENIFAGLGIVMPPATPTPLVKRDLSFKTKWNGTHDKDFKLGMTSEEFQLMHFGPYMDRNMDSKPDGRVPFEPDGWQRQVLDEIDSGNSIFIVAPTSAGKTFISFHAMEKVLKADDDGILVYVAPTKALVNQIAAEIISRFRKNYKQSGKTVWAIHTRDYRMHEPNQCQILVTVPHILLIMLLSPANAERWSPRVKRIIFDEVHSIGNAEDGVVWEQLLLLSPCAIIALSATVGNANEFSEWLKSTQNSMGFKLSMIQHQHRYSDLRKYVHRAPTGSINNQPFGGLGKAAMFSRVDDISELESIHPVASLDVSQGIPDDLALESRDCLALIGCMKDVETQPYPVPDHLMYQRVFGESGEVIKKRDVIDWATDLKAFLKTWASDAHSPFQELIKKLGRKEASEPVQQGMNSASANSTPKKGRSAAAQNWGTLSLLSALHSENALPAIMFSYDRGLCESLCTSLCQQLEHGEREWRAKDPKWKAKLEEWEAWKKSKASRAASKPRKIVTEDMSKANIMVEMAERENSPFESFDPLDPSPGFTFADTKKCSKSALEEEIQFLDSTAPTELITAFRRGIGIHHAGMNRKYRQAVETLFRKGYLKVVIATGTLALGINMPCKTVVFAGDSVYLSTLNFRQASGRAGRRGFDLIGNVIFHGLPLSKAHRLISSRLPSLMSHFPISTSLVLQLFILLHNSNQSEHAKKCINSLLTQPRLVMGGQSFKEQTLHHLRFSIEFLRRQGFLGHDGTPLNFAGLAAHLYYFESSVFSLHALLCSGYFQMVCKDVRNPARRKRIGLDLILIMAHIFGHRLVPKSGNIPALPPLPDKAKKILIDYNQDTLETYSEYVETFAKKYCNTADNILPFSKQRCGGDGVGFNKPRQNPARSNFVGLSGHNGGFSDIEDLTASVRSDIFLEGSSVPYLPLLDEASDEQLNNYLYTFFKDGDAAKLERENGIRGADVWFVLKDFSSILATVVTGLQCYLKDGPGAYFDNDAIDKVRDALEKHAKENEDDDEYDKGEDDDEYDEDEDDDYEGKEETKNKDFVKVLEGFLILQSIFEEKFRKIFA